MRDILSDAAKTGRTGNGRKLVVATNADDEIIIITKNVYKELPEKLMDKKTKKLG